MSLLAPRSPSHYGVYVPPSSYVDQDDEFTLIDREPDEPPHNQLADRALMAAEERRMLEENGKYTVYCEV
jgi:hypothetical protein